MRNKFEVASVRDVFLSANYWRLYDHIEVPPKLVLDLGANCGHFTVLMHLLILEKFAVDSTNYVLVEPTIELQATLKRVLKEVGISGRSTIHQALIGKKDGSGCIKTSKQNLLITSVAEEGETEIPYIDPMQILGDAKTIDIVKIDIEGSEFELLSNFPQLFEKAQLVAIELHSEKGSRLDFLKKMNDFGLEECSDPIFYRDASMHILKKRI